LHNSLRHLLLKNGDFLNTYISQGSVATRLGCGRVFVYDFVTNSLLSLRVNLKIGQYLVKLWARVGCLVFFDSRYNHSCCMYIGLRSLVTGRHTEQSELLCQVRPFRFFSFISLYSSILICRRIEQFFTDSVNAMLLMNSSSFAAIAILLQ